MVFKLGLGLLLVMIVFLGIGWMVAILKMMLDGLLVFMMGGVVAWAGRKWGCVVIMMVRVARGRNMRNRVG